MRIISVAHPGESCGQDGVEMQCHLTVYPGRAFH